MQRELLSKASALIAGCDCETGCPTCVGPVGETGPLAKTVAIRLLEHLLGRSEDDGLRSEGDGLRSEGDGFSRRQGVATAEAVALQTDDEVPF